MFGILLVFIGTFFGEISDSIVKDKVLKKEQSLYVMGFFTYFFATVWFLLIILIRGEFVFSLASLPTFIPRLVLEIVMAHVTVLAIIRADRSTFGFIRVLTIPLLLLVDIILGYQLSIFQIIGILLIVVIIAMALYTREINKKGVGYVLFTAIVAVLTISLFKYNITHFNSVEAEQMLILVAVSFYFLFVCLLVKKINPLKLTIKPVYFFQSLSSAVSGVLMSYAYLFAPASVILTAKRSTGILWNVFSGYMYFREKHLFIKLIFLILLITGIILLVF